MNMRRFISSVFTIDCSAALIAVRPVGGFVTIDRFGCWNTRRQHSLLGRTSRVSPLVRGKMTSANLDSNTTLPSAFDKVQKDFETSIVRFADFREQARSEEMKLESDLVEKAKILAGTCFEQDELKELLFYLHEVLPCTVDNYHRLYSEPDVNVGRDGEAETKVVDGKIWYSVSYTTSVFRGLEVSIFPIWFENLYEIREGEDSYLKNEVDTYVWIRKK